MKAAFVISERDNINHICQLLVINRVHTNVHLKVHKLFRIFGQMTKFTQTDCTMLKQHIYNIFTSQNLTTCSKKTFN